MSDSGYTYSATSRIPIRPLSIDNKDLALPRELLMDYANANIYICDLTGKIINITQKMIDQTDKMIEDNLKSSDTKDVIRNVTIDLEDGSKVTIEYGIVQLFNQIATTNQNLNTMSNEIYEYIEKEVESTIPTAAENTPKASAEKGSIGSKSNVFALEDHVHPKGLATVADSANSVEWNNVKNAPSFSSSDHNHDTVYYKKSGGDISGEIGLPNSKGLCGYTTANARAYIAYIDSSNRIHIGSQNNLPIILDAKIILNSTNYGTAAPPTSGAVAGQVYFQLI